jgi:hypothetical protein
MNSEIKFPDTPGFSGPFLFGLSAYRGKYVEREPVIISEIGRFKEPKICIVCGNHFESRARNIKTCSSECRMKRRLAKKEEEKLLREMDVKEDEKEFWQEINHTAEIVTGEAICKDA